MSLKFTFWNIVSVTVFLIYRFINYKNENHKNDDRTKIAKNYRGLPLCHLNIAFYIAFLLTTCYTSYGIYPGIKSYRFCARKLPCISHSCGECLYINISYRWIPKKIKTRDRHRTRFTGNTQSLRYKCTRHVTECRYGRTFSFLSSKIKVDSRDTWQNQLN